MRSCYERYGPRCAGAERRTCCPAGCWSCWSSSLALNLLVLGLVGSLIWRMRVPPPWAHAVAPNLLGYASTLPAERRKELWERSDKELQHIRPFRRDVRAARQETVKALAAEPFDRQQFVAAQTRQMEAENRAREAVQSLYVTIAESLTRGRAARVPELARAPAAGRLQSPRRAGQEARGAEQALIAVRQNSRRLFLGRKLDQRRPGAVFCRSAAERCTLRLEQQSAPGSNPGCRPRGRSLGLPPGGTSA